MPNSTGIHCYKLCGYNIVLDIASGAVHSVDDLAFDAISKYNDFDDKSELVLFLSEKHPNVIDNEIISLSEDIKQLIIQGKLFSADTRKKILNSQFSILNSLKALCLNVSHSCNMSCAYCFANYASCGAGDDSFMSLETGKRAIDFLIENSGNIKTLDVDFFGGEPLLNWDVVKGIVLYARGLEQKCNKKLRFTLTTNGVLIDDEVIRFTGSHMHNVVLSLDGRPEVHDKYRKLLGGSGSYSDVVSKFRKLVEARRGKGYYIRGTYTRENLDFLNDILHIADLGFKEISLEPVVGVPGTAFEIAADDLVTVFDQYEALAVEMLRREVIGQGFSFYHFNLDLKKGPCVHKRIAGCGVAESYLAVTPKGELFPCHQFVGDDKFKMGDIWQSVNNNELKGKFSSANIYTQSKCRDCWARFYCSGGCAANNFYSGGGFGGLYQLGCEIFKKRIECAIMMQAAKM